MHAMRRMGTIVAAVSQGGAFMGLNRCSSDTYTFIVQTKY